MNVTPPDVEDLDEAMPPGFQQRPLAPTRRQLAEHFAIMYGLSVLGIVLAPVAFLLRLGRWSMRTIWCHHVGHEFGGF